MVCQVAFASERTGSGDIYLMEGSAQTRLTTSPAVDGEPAFFPAAGKIAFASNRAGNSEIYSMNASGTAPTRLTTDPGWTPNHPGRPTGRRSPSRATGPATATST